MRRAWTVAALFARVTWLASPAGAAERPWRTTEAPQGLRITPPDACKTSTSLQVERSPTVPG
ncbi:hypothetical protein ACQPZ8_16255 [Actinomadura nitritigenes]|uniref:hypothetical protein n=1 Tax=Actinomadura nitritigenes TaxID=134602 RepID=UPI003D8CF37F